MLTECPLCDYALVGLPDTYACPECGLEYDASTEVVRVRRSNLKVVRFWTISVILAVALTAYFVFGRLLFLVLGVMGVVEVLVMSYCAERRQGRFILLSDSALTIARVGRPLQKIEWTSIRLIEWSWISGNIVIHHGSRYTRTRLPGMSFGFHRQAKDFVDRAETRRLAAWGKHHLQERG